MTLDLTLFLATADPVVAVRLTQTRGSTPRDAGAEMFVTAQGMWGTIGGGQLEFMALERARAMLRDGVLSAVMPVPLGPEIGQCCGGFVEVSLTRMRQADRQAVVQRIQAETAALPHVYILGAGHVGRALALQLQHLPLRCVVIDSRAEELALCAAQVEMRATALPEAEIAAAPQGSAFVVLTHDHGLDFLLAAAALERGDAGYIGMIGSRTKREKFARWARDQTDIPDISALTCPIGAGRTGDKQPAVIAAMVAAEVVQHLLNESKKRIGCESPSSQGDSAVLASSATQSGSG